MKKKILIWIAAIIGVSFLIWFGVGNYFVNYALVPGQGGEDRQVEDVINISSENQRIINENRTMHHQKCEEWLTSVSDLTETIHITAQDNVQLVGHTYQQEDTSNKWVIIVHGYQMDEKESQKIAPFLYEAGYNILTMDLRAHGASEGDYIGMGYLDQYDLKEWVDWLVHQYPDSEIALHGSSMGGATVLLAGGLKLPDNVKVIIDDCGYSSIRDIFASELDKRFGLPAFPILDMAGTVSQIRAGYNINDGDVIEATKQNTLPTLFIHGAVDDFVPVEMAEALYQAKLGENKILSIYQDAGHVEPKYSDPERYYGEIVQFLAENMKDS
ncbi:alpha/beta hydrolase [Aerococcaceae bacterium DSM 111020]|nr:alpha/beta hydrolase [Aerococcaceae bacterium DSM 111020]